MRLQHDLVGARRLQAHAIAQVPEDLLVGPPLAVAAQEVEVEVRLDRPRQVGVGVEPIGPALPDVPQRLLGEVARPQYQDLGLDWAGELRRAEEPQQPPVEALQPVHEQQQPLLLEQLVHAQARRRAATHGGRLRLGRCHGRRLRRLAPRRVGHVGKGGVLVPG